ncbi:MAG: flagellar FlbD family protein [Candidatus Firestonebacteria bacterium]
MIKLKKITGEEILVNLDLIETIERHSDTVISLTTGNKLLVKDSLDEITNKIVEYKRSIKSQNA